MATGMQAQNGTGSFATEVRTVAEKDPKAALEMAIRESERVRAEAEMAAIEFRELSEVRFGNNGMESSSAAGMWRLAKLFSESDLVPDHFKRRRANCFIAIQMAFRCRVDPMAFLQRCYIVHGRPAIESQLAIAMANGSGLFDGRIRFEMSGAGDSRACRAHAKMKDSGETIEEVCSVTLAKSMNWWGKKDSLWPKMTDLMLKYRSAMWLIRTNAPEVLMGLQAKEEANDDAVASVDTNGKQAKSLDALTNRLTGLVPQSSVNLDEPIEETAAEAPKEPEFQLSSEESQESSLDPDNPLVHYKAEMAKCVAEIGCKKLCKDFQAAMHEDYHKDAEEIRDARINELKAK